MLTVRGPQGHTVTLSVTNVAAKAECTCGERFETAKSDRFDGYAAALVVDEVNDHMKEAHRCSASTT